MLQTGGTAQPCRGCLTGERPWCVRVGHLRTKALPGNTEGVGRGETGGPGSGVEQQLREAVAVSGCFEGVVTEEGGQHREEARVPS